MIYPFLLQNWRRLKTIKIISVLINVLWNEHVQTLYQCLVSVWQYELRAFKKIITFSSIILLRKFIRDTDKDAYSKMFTTALFIVRRNYKSSQSPAIGGRRNQFWCIQMIREYAAIKNHIFWRNLGRVIHFTYLPRRIHTKPYELLQRQITVEGLKTDSIFSMRPVSNVSAICLPYFAITSISFNFLNEHAQNSAPHLLCPKLLLCFNFLLQVIKKTRVLSDGSLLVSCVSSGHFYHSATSFQVPIGLCLHSALAPYQMLWFLASNPSPEPFSNSFYIPLPD